MTSQFDIATAVSAVSFDDAQPPRFVFEATISDIYNVGKVPNGGYSLAVMYEAMRQALKNSHTKDPVALTATYINAVELGIAQIQIQVAKSGAKQSIVEAIFLQKGKEKIRLTSVWGTLFRSDQPRDHQADRFNQVLTHRKPPKIAAPEEVPLVPPIGVQFSYTTEFRAEPKYFKAMTAPGSKPEVVDASIVSYVRLPGREPDLKALCYFADSWVPTVFNWPESRVTLATWMPTLQMQVIFLQPPSNGWILANVKSNSMVGAYIEEEVELWDARKQLVAIARQVQTVSTVFVVDKKASL